MVLACNERNLMVLACNEQIKPECSALLQRLQPLYKHAGQRRIHPKPVCYVGA